MPEHSPTIIMPPPDESPSDPRPDGPVDPSESTLRSASAADGSSWASSVGAGATHTDWSMIDRAVHGHGGLADRAREMLMRRYWPAVYAYIRKSGRDIHDAADLTQGFICDVMIGRELLEGADRRRGRFRSLLLTALKNYLHERHRYDTRQKRSPGPGQRRVSIEASAVTGAEVNTDRTPEAEFSAQWAASVVRHVLACVSRECRQDGLEAHWTIFECRVARPLMTGAPPTPYVDLVRELDLDDTAQASNMMITVKRRFAKRLRAEIARTLPDEYFVEDELFALMRDLQGG